MINIVLHFIVRCNIYVDNLLIVDMNKCINSVYNWC